jgi:PAS domain S-box-containing protein
VEHLSAKRMVAAMAVALLAISTGLDAGAFGRGDLADLLGEVTYLALIGGAGAALLAKGLASRQAGWTFLGLGLCAWLVGEIYFALAVDPVLGPYPSLADGFFFAFYLLALVGLRRLGGRIQGQPLLSAGLVTSMLGLATIWSWLVFNPVVAGLEGEKAAIATTLTYPLADLVLLCSVLLALAGNGWRPNRPLLALAAGITVMGLADALYLGQVGTAGNGWIVVADSLWPAGAMLIACAPWAGGAEVREHPGLKSERVVVALGLVSMAVAVSVLVADHFERFNDLTVWLATATLAASAIQLALLHRARDRADAGALRAHGLEDKANAQLAAIVRSSGDAILSTDLDGIVTAWNRGAEALYGYSATEAIGAPHASLIFLPNHRDEADELTRDVVSAGVMEFDTKRITKRGAVVDISLRAFALRDVSGAITGVSTIAHDTTDRRVGEKRARGDHTQGLWRDRIERALDDGRFVFWGQPVVDTHTGELHHHELLLRMRHEGAIITPNHFLPHAESSDLIRRIDRWAVAKGIEIAETTPVAINLSARSLGDVDLFEVIERELEESSASPGDLTFEITETAAAGELESARELVEHLTLLGCDVSLDDFGTGFGCFTYLKHLPVTELKIDIDFIRHVAEDFGDRRVVAAMVSVAKQFGIRTVAEGVEDEATLECLRDLDVDLVQGYHLGRPARMRGQAGRRQAFLNLA